VQEDPGFDLSQGFTIDVALRAEGKGAGRALNLGNVLGLEVTSANSVRGWFLPTAFDKTGSPSPAGRTSAESAPGSFARGRWFRARLTYDLRFLRLFVDGRRGGARRGDRSGLAAPRVRCGFSDPKAGFPGAIDELTVAAVTSGSPAAPARDRQARRRRAGRDPLRRRRRARSRVPRRADRVPPRVPGRHASDCCASAPTGRSNEVAPRTARARRSSR
jgi:hypothetical protein